MQTLQFDEFLRSLKQNTKASHSVLLGAGASIESVIKSAVNCILIEKKDFSLFENLGVIGQYTNVNIKTDTVHRSVQNWFDLQNCHHLKNSSEEYFLKINISDCG